MAVNELSPNMAQVQRLLNDLTDKITQFPELYREQIVPDIQNIQDCLKGQDFAHSQAAAKNTAGQKSEEALQGYDDRFALLFRSNPAPMTVFRLSDGQHVDVNESYCELVGYSREDVIGHTAEEFEILTSPDQPADLLRVLGEQGEVRNHEVTIRTKSGELRDLLLSTRHIELDGEPHLLVTRVDISGRKRMEEALLASEARERARVAELEAMMDAVPAMIWISHDRECREMIGNKYGYQFLRMEAQANVSKTAPEEALARQRYENMRDGKPIPTSELPMQIAAATGKPAQDYEFDLVFDDGKLYHLLGNVNPLFDEAGAPAGAVGSFVDVTAMRQLQEHQMKIKADLEVKQRLIEQREQERQGIAREIHDGPIQTLASTAFNIQIMKESFQDLAVEEGINKIGQEIKNAARELRGFVNELRPPSMLRFGLARALQAYLEDIENQHPGIEFVQEIMEDEKKLSDQTSLALFRICQECLHNTIKHAGATRIWVRLTIEPAAFVLELRDNGKGFILIEDISELVSRGHYGLMGMKERAEMIGGAFKLISEPGQGTTVQVKGPFTGKTGSHKKK